MPSHERHGSPRPTSERRPAKQQLGEQELRGMISHSLTELGAELQAGKSERLLQYLDFAARFHYYSRANQFLIVHQRPDATRVASYKKWQELGYQVAKGETGIRILAPTIKKQKDEESDKERRVETGFVAVSVFDVAQLTPEKRPPAFFEPLEGDQQALCEAIVTAATADGFQVDVTAATRGAQGYSVGRRIVTREGLDTTSRALTLFHEWAHGLLHQGVHALTDDRSLTRELKECHAEATAWVAARHFGVKTPYSSDYLLQWDTTPELLREELDAIVKAASHIISSLLAVTGGEQVEDQMHESQVEGSEDFMA
jgi:antirestriction protein ArdC